MSGGKWRVSEASGVRDGSLLSIDNKDQFEDVIHRRILTTIDNCLSTREKECMY